MTSRSSKPITSIRPQNKVENVSKNLTNEKNEKVDKIYEQDEKNEKVDKMYEQDEKSEKVDESFGQVVKSEKVEKGYGNVEKFTGRKELCPIEESKN